jgi:hypothetical protein
MDAAHVIADAVTADDMIAWGESGAAQILTRAYEIQLEVPIDLAWQRMVHEVDGWWPHTYKEGSTVLIEAFPGGRWWERFADGVNGSLWGHVVYIEPPRILKVVGQFALPGVSNSAGVWRMEENEQGTLLKVSGEMLGAFDLETLKSRKSGTVEVINSLRDFVNTGVPINRDNN